MSMSGGCLMLLCTMKNLFEDIVLLAFNAFRCLHLSTSENAAPAPAVTAVRAQSVAGNIIHVQICPIITSCADTTSTVRASDSE